MLTKTTTNTILERIKEECKKNYFMRDAMANVIAENKKNGVVLDYGLSEFARVVYLLSLNFYLEINTQFDFNNAYLNAYISLPLGKSKTNRPIMVKSDIFIDFSNEKTIAKSLNKLNNFMFEEFAEYFNK